MAKFFPEFENIKNLKQEPEPSELYALKVLQGLPDNCEVYFHPFINGNIPDVVILRKGYGVLVIEIKDWRNFHIDENDNWVLHVNEHKFTKKSPVEQVKAYKNDLYNLSIPSLLPRKLADSSYYLIVQTAIYLHSETYDSIRSKNIKTDKWCPIYGRDNFTVNAIMSNDSIWRKYPNKLFSDEIYDEFKRVLEPSFHTLEQAKGVNLSPKQKKLSVSQDKQQKICGVAGSGKTLVLAQRAVNSHIRHDNRVLILTYNITLRNYIRDNISRVRREFDWSNFHIIHYDAFIFSEANNHNLYNIQTDDVYLFEDVKGDISKYSAIFIDEVQDYQKEWIEIIKKYFLKDGGEFIVFGDEKQNIYGKDLDKHKKPNSTIPGRWAVLNESFRLSGKILQLAEDFQSKFFKEKYELDDVVPIQGELGLSKESIEYRKFSSDNSISDLSNFINNKIKEHSIQPQNICILGHTNQLLRELDFEIRSEKQQKTNTTFETQEMYENLQKKGLNKEQLELTIRAIRKNKRFNFWMNSSMKLSTVHSFKGWEINTLFLIIDNKSSHETREVIYTALTRCRSKLFILNIDNDEYDDFFSEKILSSAIIDSKEITSEKVVQKNDNKKTIGKIIEEDSASSIFYNFSKCKEKGLFNMLVLGEISGEQGNFKKILNDFLAKHGISAQEWNVDFWNNKDIKRKDIKSLRIGQSKYNLLITGQIHQHSSKGNKQGNLISELMNPKYVKRIYGSKPQKRLTADNFIDKLEEYLSRYI
jgi:thymidine kinase